ncbi:hypothetical protein C8A01DRAFT_20235 [Parachaetomium inaequale]|uniref:Rhodopsin domain-containing protein n=1 Tax=Parachaetomium inaequale TaxID=2588326 RepID=A0AAN6SM56_9PEZI|nr:hypothetical protein C8A01DRAFT_20235 [Parachaetomium inaequale]
MPHPHASLTQTQHTGRATEGEAGHENLGPYLLRVVWPLAALSTLFLGLRAYCKLSRRHRLWWDDYILIASWVSLIYSVVLQTVGVSYGLGRHYGDLSDEAISTMGMYSMASGFGSILATCWSKTSFAITLLRISDGSSTRLFIWFIILSVNLVLGSNGVIHWVQCWPVAKTWHYYMPGSCLPADVVRNYNTAVAVFSGVMDILLALLPWQIIWTITINKRERLGALVAMSAGILTGVMAFLKIKTMYVIGNSNATTVDLIIFGTAEPATAIMAASIPMLRVLIQRRPSSKPSQFVELVSPRKTESTIASPVPRPDSITHVIKWEPTAEVSWPEAVAVEHAARGRRQSEKGIHVENHGWAA